MFATAPETIAARIRSERLRLGLTQVEAARRSGMARTTYTNLERSASPSLRTLFALTAVGMDVRAIAPELFQAGRRAPPRGPRGKADPDSPPRAVPEVNNQPTRKGQSHD